MIKKPSIRLTHREYTIGWICALPKEAEAASFMLDVEHLPLSNPRADTNAYWLGAIGDHNVAIACLPSGSYGNNSSATVAARMISTFPNIKVGLMVGIGGGVPPNVRLGDVVVSQSMNGHPAVVQWDMGKTEEGGKFKRTGSLNNPPTAVMTALSKFRATSISSRQKILDCLDGLKTRSDVPKTFLKSDSMKDPLCVTQGAEGNGQDLREDMQIHYGLIASGNQVIKDTATRDRLNADFNGNVLCVEMEAAGLMNEFPCLVIRGICDYADEHKNKVWQEYAAAVAAAYAKSLLSVLPVSEMDGLKSIKVEDVVSSTFLEDVKKRFWGDKKEDATQPAASEKTLEKEMSENQNGQTLPSQPETPTNGDTGAPLRDTYQQQNPVRQPTQPDHPASSPQVRDIEFGMRDININYHQMPSPPAGQNGGNNSEQEKDSKPPSSQYEFKQQRNNTSAFGNCYTSQAPGDHSNLTSPQAEGPHYGGSHSQTPRSLDRRFNGNVTDQSVFGGGFQDQNARNLPTQPAEWSGNGTYAPRTPGPRDNPYQTPPYQSPVNKNNINTPDQYNGGYNGNPQEQNGMNPQTPPSTWSGNGGYAPGPRDNSYYTPPYQSPVYNNNNNAPGQYSGNYAGNLQDQNGSNPQALPPWPGNGGYNPETTGPHYNYHQTPPYQSPAYSNTPGQHLGYGNDLGYGNEVAPTVHCSYPQISPTQGFSGNGYQNNLGDYYNAYGGWPGINGAATGANAPYNAFPGPKLNDPQTSQALFQAVRRGDLPAVEQLLRSSADPEVKNTFGYTPLWIAVQTEQLALIRLLLHYGADRTAMNTYGETILAWATKRNKKVIVETLSSM